ncbi:MAG: AMP-binding protein [Alphaproteobacteria bacterium]|nr:AMP-binding protein [Alphaproteobacteria bacterium]
MTASASIIDEEDPYPWGADDRTIGALLEARAARDPDFVFCRFGEERIPFRELDRRVNCFANGLLALGIGAEDRVAIMLPNHPDHIVAFLALAKLGICQVPVNVHLRGAGLEDLIAHCRPRALIIDARYGAQIATALAKTPVATVIWRGGRHAAAGGESLDFAAIARHADAGSPARRAAPGETLSIMYTSGTTGMPKGVLLTDRMLRVCARASRRLADVRTGDVLFLWEPLYHIGGCEVMVLALMEAVTIGLVERFSVAQFWSQVRGYGATHMHYLGGVLALLLKEPPREEDAANPIRIAWGGGCPVTIWEAFEKRFGIAIRECYGMTEASSFTTQNRAGKIGSIGTALPYFEVRIADAEGRFLGPGERGEIRVREKMPGLIMPGYFRAPEATAAALQDGWLRTGDLGWQDEEGFFFYAGRTKDCVRRRGENIAAFEVERVFDAHPEIAECAVIGVPNELSDEDIKLFVRPKPGCRPDPRALIQWCESRMARFQIPRYIAFVDALPKTATERLRKELLPRDVAGCFDREKPRTVSEA